ncbi:hypothetical protein E2C01_061285 [Portunus trituberculatus]|uniref:Uncharacterized protein n=1 Tax=Portunus trituberculatus TaxID=210409 RepID=A0A5B7HB92_PORTR|nr:hypothetical protein [Portunus trituberculatus]
MGRGLKEQADWSQTRTKPVVHPYALGEGQLLPKT